MRAARTALLLLAALTVAGTCPSDLVESVAGRYLLVSVDGEAPPVTVTGTGELMEGVMEFERLGFCSLELVYDTGTQGESCEWARSGSTLTITWDQTDLAFWTFDVEAERVSGSYNGLALVLEK